MNKAYILALAIALPSHAIAADTDSVHTWGAWAQNIQPAAGPTARVTPTPVIQPKVNFRPNENSAFTRSSLKAAIPAQPGLTPAVPASPSIGGITPGAELSPPTGRTPPPAPSF